MLCVFKFKMPSQKFDMKNSSRVILIIISIIKVNIIKIYTNNTHFITTQYGITKILLKQSLSSFAYKTVTTYLIIIIVTNQSGINLNAARISSTASSCIL